MLAILSAVVAFAISGACGYSNTSPAFVYSSTDLGIHHYSSRAGSLQDDLYKAIEKCPTTHYLLVKQPGVTSEDYLSAKNTPFLQERMQPAGGKGTSKIIRDVTGMVWLQELTTPLSRTCKKEVKTVTCETLAFPELDPSKTKDTAFLVTLPELPTGLSAEERQSKLQDHDTFVASLVSNYFNNKDYTLIYTTDSVEAQRQREQSLEGKVYESEMPLNTFMGELVKRNVAKEGAHSSRSSNQTIVDGPLFDKYQFFGPGIFMGLFTGVILLAILYVGISALTSLQVTYGAFDKEQGQLAAKKQ